MNDELTFLRWVYRYLIEANFDVDELRDDYIKETGHDIPNDYRDA